MEPASQAVLDRLIATCSDENPEKLVTTLADIMLCKGPSKCLSQAIKQTAEFEQPKAVQMSESCAQAEGTPASIRASRNAAMAALLMVCAGLHQSGHDSCSRPLLNACLLKVTEGWPGASECKGRLHHCSIDAHLAAE